MTDIEAKRQTRRAAMPNVTAFFEQFAEFAPTLIYAQESGISYGKQPEDKEAFTIPKGYGLSTYVKKGK
jgi:hypothetical protein